VTYEELYALFRSDVTDAVAPYLWSDTEVQAYANDAYSMFVRLTKGIPDSTSALTQVPVVAGEATATVSPLILKFKSAYLVSTGKDLRIVNEGEVPRLGTKRVGEQVDSHRNPNVGNVSHMVVGLGRNAASGGVRWHMIPKDNDTVQLSVMRLPLSKVEPGFEFDEIGEEHHYHLLLWMKHLAYGKQDAETFDRGRRDEFERKFREYCGQATREWDRYRTHTQVVAYGGL